MKHSVFLKSGAILLAAVAGLMGASEVRANTITNPAIASVAFSTLTDWAGNLAFEQFDPSLGTLDEVEVDVSVPWNTQVLVTNNSPNSGSHGSDETNLQLTLVDPDNIWAGNSPIVNAIDSKDWSYNLAPGGSFTSPVWSGTATGAMTDTTSALLAEFTGTGTIPLSASTFTQTLLANTGGNTASDQITHAGLTGTVIYTYVPFADGVAVPVPAVIPGAAVLLGMMGVARKMRLA